MVRYIFNPVNRKCKILFFFFFFFFQNTRSNKRWCISKFEIGRYWASAVSTKTKRRCGSKHIGDWHRLLRSTQQQPHQHGARRRRGAFFPLHCHITKAPPAATYFDLSNEHTAKVSLVTDPPQNKIQIIRDQKYPSFSLKIAQLLPSQHLDLEKCKIQGRVSRFDINQIREQHNII
jgi:hypothetical protein